MKISKSGKVRVELMLDPAHARYLDRVTKGKKKAPFVQELLDAHGVNGFGDGGIIERMAARIEELETRISRLEENSTH